MAKSSRWDIFCRVVDNYGDAGVCWRLARQLANEHALDVTLWQDELAPLARIAPGVDGKRDQQRAMGVTIRRWAEPFLGAEPADVVVEAFGCGLPEPYVAAMVGRSIAPAWFVLEYLSAESWVDGAHGLPSPHPRLPLTRRFWFPGFTRRTGGLLCERGLLAVRDATRRDDAAQHRFWASLALPPIAPDEIRVSLFCYPNPALPALLDTWADGDAPVSCVVPEGVAVGALDLWTGGNLAHPGAPIVRGRLTLQAIAFLAQDDYDRLLWASTVNFVRGEDSFVRAQWAARPLVWQPYPQAENAHLAKLDAFVDRYVGSLPAASASALRNVERAWNGVPGSPPVADAWQDFAAALAALDRHAAEWARDLATLPSLAEGLVNAATDRV
ncbi:MAG: elongation factor P maturation arginine rhamnosyltransferase EarP [Betaproteobacteria bacterium]